MKRLRLPAHGIALALLWLVVYPRLGSFRKRPKTQPKPTEYNTASSFYTVCYAPETQHRSQYDGDKSFRSISNISLRSTCHLGTEVTLVVPENDTLCTSLAAGLPNVRVQRVTIPERSSWVMNMQEMQSAYMSATKSFETFIYFELDMFFLPGAGRYLLDIFAKSKVYFDVAYTYRGANKDGSVNTGVIFYRRVSSTFEWLNAVTSTTQVVVNEWSRDASRSAIGAGGQNQIAIDRLGATDVPHGQIFHHVDYNVSILSLPMDVINNADRNCCSPGNALVLHFKGLAPQKQQMLSKCCRDILDVHA